MASKHRDVDGNWYGMMVHHPSRAVIHVSLEGENGSFKGTWDLASLTRGQGRKGSFTATRFSHLLHVRITTKPFTNVQCQLTIFEKNGVQMLTGVIPFEGAAVPFGSVTLYRFEPVLKEMDGICPIFEFCSV